MYDEDILLVTGRQVEAALAGRHKQIIDVIRGAYEAHGRQADTLPQASILRFADDPRNRIIALPARLDLGAGGPGTGGRDVAGIKWISSFPANTEAGLERASAVILLNSMRTGRVTAVMEGSAISAKRTAASAALAAAEVHGVDRPPAVLGLIGCGRINYEILRFILAAGPAVKSVVVHDQSASRAAAFMRRCAAAAPGLAVAPAETATDVLGTCSLVSFATTATEPYVTDLSMCPRGSTILHISLRDIAPRAILDAENLVDDVDHVCAARTSVHLAEQAVGHRRFIKATIGDVLLGRATARGDAARPLVFSPFGMGTLDIALAGLVLDTVRAEAPAVPDFWPASWLSDAPEAPADPAAPTDPAAPAPGAPAAAERVAP